MQSIDPADKRPPNEKIAASIRAGILTGELQPGSRLPSYEDLAEFFGHSRMTVVAAVRKLSDEGFVRSVGGSGTYVRDHAAALPGPQGEEQPLADAAKFLYEMGYLKKVPRTGWQLLGVADLESVAEHSFRVGMTCMVLASIDGADVGRTVALGLFHDGHETRIGDVPSVGRAYVTTAKPEAITGHQTAGMPEPAAKTLQDLTAEYEACETREALLAHDADKIETLLQAREYASQGYDTAGWQETSLTALRTDTGTLLARAIGATDPHDWFKPFQASYHEQRDAGH
jgi:putative hydrolase of HD superfamily